MSRRERHLAPIDCAVVDQDDPSPSSWWVPSVRLTRPWCVTVREYAHYLTDDDGAYRPYDAPTGVRFRIGIHRWAWMGFLRWVIKSAGTMRAVRWAWRHYERVHVVYEVPANAAMPDHLAAYLATLN